MGGLRAVSRGEYWEGLGQYLEGNIGGGLGQYLEGNIGRMGGRRAVSRGEYWEGARTQLAVATSRTYLKVHLLKVPLLTSLFSSLMSVLAGSLSSSQMLTSSSE